MENNKSNVERFFRGYKKNFENSLTSDVRPQWTQIATRVTSTTAVEDYTWLGNTEEMREWIGARTPGKVAIYDYSLRNKPYEVSYELSVNTIADDNFGLFPIQGEGLGRAARNWPNTQVFSALSNGNATTLHGACFNGSAFFSATHPTLDGTSTFANYTDIGGASVASPWYLLDTSRTLKPFIMQVRKDPTFWAETDPQASNVLHNGRYTYGVDARGVAGYGLPQLAHRSEAALSEATFTAAKTLMRDRRNDAGLPMGVNPNILLVGAANEEVARKMLAQNHLASGESNYLQTQPIELMVVNTLP